MDEIIEYGIYVGMEFGNGKVGSFVCGSGIGTEGPHLTGV